MDAERFTKSFEFAFGLYHPQIMAVVQIYWAGLSARWTHKVIVRKPE